MTKSLNQWRDLLRDALRSGELNKARNLARRVVHYSPSYSIPDRLRLAWLEHRLGNNHETSTILANLVQHGVDPKLAHWFVHEPCADLDELFTRPWRYRPRPPRVHTTPARASRNGEQPNRQKRASPRLPNEQRQVAPTLRAPQWAIPAVPASQPPGDASIPEAIELTWEVLPQGWLDDPLVAAKAMSSTKLRRGHEIIRSRLLFLDSLRPAQWYRGSHLGKTAYFVAEFPRLAIADSPLYGDALYYCLTPPSNWRSVFRLTKTAARREGASKIVHSRTWQLKVRTLVTTISAAS